VQIASVRTAAAAAKGWQKLSRQHADLLKGLKSSIVRADLGRKGVFHRLQAGPVPSREAAEGLCAKLKSRRVGCMIVRP
jgi:cell division septation protein DedD